MGPVMRHGSIAGGDPPCERCLEFSAQGHDHKCVVFSEMANPAFDDPKGKGWRPRVYVRVVDRGSPSFGEVGRVLRVTDHGLAFIQIASGAMLQFRFDQFRSIASEK